MELWYVHNIVEANFVNFKIFKRIFLFGEVFSEKLLLYWNLLFAGNFGLFFNLTKMNYSVLRYLVDCNSYKGRIWMKHYYNSIELIKFWTWRSRVVFLAWGLDSEIKSRPFLFNDNNESEYFRKRVKHLSRS